MCSVYAPRNGDIFAVLNSPESVVTVAAPSDRGAARRLKANYRFFCATTLGGCGDELTFAIGDKNVPHFRHRTGGRCPLAAAVSAKDLYTHLAIQTALQNWVQGIPGFTCQLEVSIAEGRTDVLAIGPTFEIALEVQRSQLSSHRGKSRTALYLQRAAAVDWLYTSPTIDAHKAEVAERGWSLRIWWGWDKRECRIGVSYESGTEPEPKIITKGGGIVEWSLTSAGLDSQYLREAVRAVGAREEGLRLRREAEAAEAERIAELKRERLAAAARAAHSRQMAEAALTTNGLSDSAEGMGRRWPSRWPVLSGTAKQVKWASKLRQGMVEELRSAPLDVELRCRVAHWLVEQTHAHFWIEKCGNYRDIYDVVLLFEDYSGMIFSPMKTTTRPPKNVLKI